MNHIQYDDYEFDPSFKVWRQKDLKVTVEYGDHYVEATGRNTPEFLMSPSTLRLNSLRAQFVDQFLEPGSRIIDIGCQMGSFIKAVEDLGNAHVVEGYEPFVYHNSIRIPMALSDVKKRTWDMMTFFDVLEHFPTLKTALELMERADMVVISVPECHFPDVEGWFMKWKHRKPGEHLWHFNRESLIDFMYLAGFSEIAFSHFEDEVRKPSDPFNTNILTSAFLRTR